MMFKKLRNRFVVINMAITTVILMVAFSAIYVSARAYERQRIDQWRANPPTVRFFDSQDMAMILDERTTESTQLLERLMLSLFLTGVATEIMVFFASFYFAENSIRPIRKVYRKQKEFVADAAHELKTPVAAALANFEAMEAEDAAAQNKWGENVRQELLKMQDLTVSLLDLAQTEDKKPVERVNLSEVVRSLVKQNKHRLKGKELGLEVAEGVFCVANVGDVRQLFNILIDNAGKYGERKIGITLDKGSFAVENDGAGIAAADLPKIFNRFYRGDKSRNSEGFGLGLPIARNIVVKYDWKIEVFSESGRTRFRVIFGEKQSVQS
jgi:signal transduction histidine kinase